MVLLATSDSPLASACKISAEEAAIRFLREAVPFAAQTSARLLSCSDSAPSRCLVSVDAWYPGYSRAQSVERTCQEELGEAVHIEPLVGSKTFATSCGPCVGGAWVRCSEGMSRPAHDPSVKGGGFG